MRRIFVDSDADDGSVYDREHDDNKFHHPTQSSQRSERKRRRGFIEKRRRDRINQSLLELKKLIPAVETKQDASKLEKAEILQMAVDYLKSLKKEKDFNQSPIAGRIDNDSGRVSGFKECLSMVSDFFQRRNGLEISFRATEIREALLSSLRSSLDHLEGTSHGPTAGYVNFHRPDHYPLHRLPPPSDGTPSFRQNSPAYYGGYHHSNPGSNHRYIDFDRLSTSQSGAASGFLVEAGQPTAMTSLPSSSSSSSLSFLTPSFRHPHNHFIQPSYDGQYPFLAPPSSSSSSSSAASSPPPRLPQPSSSLLSSSPLSSSSTSSFYHQRLDLIGPVLASPEPSLLLPSAYGGKPYRPWGWEVTC